MTQPLVVACGVGRDSMGVLVGLWLRGIRPDAILFADVGSERQSTYDYLKEVLQPWLARIGFPPVTVVRYECRNFKHWPEYRSLEENCLTNGTLPSIAYGRHACSAKWKIAPQNEWLKSWNSAISVWSTGGKVRKAIGFESSEANRSARCNTYAVSDDEGALFDFWFPLQEWGWDLEACIEAIQSAGLPVPEKSACYFCTAMKPREVDSLPADKLKRIVVIEWRATEKHLAYAERKGWPKGIGIALTEGLWRKRVKGFRGAIPKPGSMTEYIRERGLLPSAEIDRIQAATPTGPLNRTQITNWQDWLSSIIDPSPPTTPLDQAKALIDRL